MKEGTLGVSEKLAFVMTNFSKQIINASFGKN